MYQYVSKGKTQTEKPKVNTPAANKSHVQIGIKMPVQTKSLFSTTFNQKSSAESPDTNYTPRQAQRISPMSYSSLQTQLMPKPERREPQVIPIKGTEVHKPLKSASIKPNNTGIPLQMKEKFESLSGFSFDDVRVHYNSDKPAQLQALAYTQGCQVYVGPGQEKCLGHELGHVVQQKSGVVLPTVHIGMLPVNDAPNLERQADHFANNTNATCAKFCAPIGQGQAVIQRYRVVQPNNVLYNQVDGEPMFSTHKIVHTKIDGGGGHNALFDQPQTEHIAPALHATMTANTVAIEQAQQALEQLGQLDQSIQQILPVLPVALAHPLMTDPQMQQNLQALQLILILVAAALPVQIATATTNLRDSFATYYKNLGLTASPQQPGGVLGQVPYAVNGAGANALDATSQFHTVFLSSNAPFPMLVSAQNQFAINAMYSDPKETYMTPGAFAAANAVLAALHPVIFDTASARVQLIPGGNQITIGGVALTKYKPLFHYQETDGVLQTSTTSAATHICDDFARMYHIPGTAAVHSRDEPDAVEDLGQQSKAPWQFHVAGALCKDGADTLSLENGARFSFLAIRGQQANPLGDTFGENQRLINEMNKTWYFRLYGPAVLGQDIAHQTISRF